MDTPITISSTLSSIEKPTKKISVPLSDSSIARIPVSWDSPLKPSGRESSCTPSTLQKVNNWINSLNKVSRDHVDNNTGYSHRRSLDLSDFDTQNGRNNIEGLVSSSVVMPELRDQRVDDELIKYCRSPYDYEHAIGSQSTSKIPDESMYGGGPMKHFHPKGIKRRRSLQNYDFVERDDGKSDDYDSDVPLSPESEKKKELCSYLQLMKPTDKKTVMILQNRRSVRVKNLSIMQEKRELEKKLKAANADNTNENGLSESITGVQQKQPGLKLFDEINVNLDKKKYKWLKYSGTKSVKDSFCFPKPTDNLKKIVSNFEDVKVYWFERGKEDVGKKRHDIAEQCKEKKVLDKKNDNGIMSPNNNDKNKVESKPQMHIIPKYIQFKRKAGAVKNEYATIPKNMEAKKKVVSKEHTTIEDDKVKTKIIDSSKKQNNNGSKSKNEDTNKTIRSQSSFDNNKFEKGRLVNLNSSTKAQFLIPTPSMHFVHDVNDFDVIIKQNRDLRRNNSLPSFPTNIENKSKIVDTSETVVVSTSPVNQGSEHSIAERKVLDTSKTKIYSLKKKAQAKKLNTERNIRRSSFKIKLKPKRKSFGSQGKSEKKLTGSKSPLISDIIRSLRNRSIETPTSEINSLKNNITTKKGKNFMNKKENIKQKLQISKNPERNIESKHLKINMEVAVKVPLKDTNKNPVKSSIISEGPKTSGKDINCKIINGDSKSFANGKTSLKINSLQNLMHDVDFCNLSTEHKTSLLVKNLNQNDISSHVPIIAIYHKNSSDGLESNNSSRDNTKERGEFYSQILNIEKYPEEDLADKRKSDVVIKEVNQDQCEQYAFENYEQSSLLDIRTKNDSELPILPSVSKGCLTPVSSKEKSVKNPEKTHKSRNEATPFIIFKKEVGVKSLHKCLNILTQKSAPANLEVENSPTSWPSESPSHKRKKSQHSINIFKDHGSVLKAFYLEYNLVLCQEFMVTFWTQTALGNVLGAQNMWIHKGSVQRMAMNNNCIFKESLEMVVSTDNNVAYIELWTKEHQSDIREGPVADVFATVYFWKKGQNGLDKKVLQLENINGFADDVQYSVLKSTPKVIVSWHLACSELESKKTYIHCYQLAADYQAVYNISEFEAVEHYVSSLHNIEGCDSLIMGCGENKITLWNIEYGYVVATIEMSDIKSPLSTLWVKCDRGFLFTLQQCVDRELRLIAIHGMNHSWKKLASYVPPNEYDRLKGVCVENGIVLAFYDQGILCWNAQTAETIVEESHNEAEYISGKYVISVVNDKVNIRHAITHLLSAEDL